MNKQSGPFTVEFLGTPEAGRTTTIKKVRKELEKSNSVKVLNEASMIIPNVFQSEAYKKTMEKHFWLRLTMVTKLLECQCTFKPDDILLVDRGIIDAYCWNYYFAGKHTIPNEVALRFKSLTETLIVPPNLVIYLKTSPDEAVRRHDGEGEIVTKQFIEDFEKSTTDFLRFSTFPVYTLDTTKMSKTEIATAVYDEILKYYEKMKNGN